MSKPRSREINYKERTDRTVHGFSTALHFGKQSKHLESINGDVSPRSVVTLPPKTIQYLIDAYAGTGEWLGNDRERVDFKTIIGIYRNKNGSEEALITRAIIHYSKKGCHIVPASPNDYRR